MSDCSPRAWQFRRTWGDTEWKQPEPRPKPQGNPTGKLYGTYDSGNPLDYPIALNGRTMQRLDVTLPDGHPQPDVWVMGVRYVPAPTRDWDSEVDE